MLVIFCNSIILSHERGGGGVVVGVVGNVGKVRQWSMEDDTLLPKVRVPRDVAFAK